MTTENPLDGFLAGAGHGPATPGAPPPSGDLKPGPRRKAMGLTDVIGMATVNEKTGEVTIEGFDGNPKMQARAKELVTNEKNQCVLGHSNGQVLDMLSIATQQHSNILAKIEREKKEFGESDGMVRAAFLAEGIAAGLSWALGFSEVNPELFLIYRMLKDPELGCADPACKGCIAVRAKALETPGRYQLPKVGVKK